MTAYNTVEKIGNKTINYINGLTLKTLENSFINNNLSVKGNVNIDITNNTAEKVGKRVVSSREMLYLRLFEKSFNKEEINTKWSIIKPLKNYKNILKLYKEYDNEIKY